MSTSTPRNVTISFTLITIFWSLIFSLGLPRLLEKSIEWVFVKLITSLFAANHVINLSISDDNVLFKWIMSELLNNTVVSSAKSINFNKLVELTISLIYNKKKRGPSVEPWGTPILQILVAEL